MMINDIKTKSELCTGVVDSLHDCDKFNLPRQFCASSTSISSLSKAAYHVVLWEGSAKMMLYLRYDVTCA